MKELLSTILHGKVTYGSALGLLALGIGAWYYGLVTPLEAVTLILNATGLAGLRRAAGNGQNELTKLLLQTALEAQAAKNGTAAKASDAP